MSLQTGGRAVGATSTRSRSASWASRSASFDRDDPDLLAVRADEPDLRYADALVDTGFGADVTSWGLVLRLGPVPGRCAATIRRASGLRRIRRHMRKGPAPVRAEPTKAAPPGENPVLVRDAADRIGSVPVPCGNRAARPAWLASPEAGSLTRQPVAGQVGGGPPLTRPARRCQAGRLVRVTAIQARWVFQATRSVSAEVAGDPRPLTRRAASPAARIASSGAGSPTLSPSPCVSPCRRQCCRTWPPRC